MSLFKASYAPVTVKLLLMKTSGRGRARLSALHMVAMADESICAGILELLLEYGADPNARDSVARAGLSNFNTDFSKNELFNLCVRAQLLGYNRDARRKLSRSRIGAGVGESRPRLRSALLAPSVSAPAKPAAC